MVTLKLPLRRAADAKAEGTNDNSPRTTATGSTAASSHTSKGAKGGGKFSTGFLASAAGIQRQRRGPPDASPGPPDAALKVQPSAGKGRWHEAYLQEFLQKVEDDPVAFEEDIKKSRALRDHRLEQENEQMASLQRTIPAEDDLSLSPPDSGPVHGSIFKCESIIVHL
ncbi:unnamed protein product [Symbiodinium sp. CCMP2592]|nr:unnamed protein product [Symbiodinium sp. CCMP2592]